ncbi:mechanosensitive ion channel family protein [Pseudoxanthomonas composti]|uniref:Mechanosensitive ion channel n=1 Tax=Pseudoxanthomonas composti TaxID=2137479 RepID=A0A4Q1JVE7_9GAMM|nr:mechanosensitive ion channel domain-containing protein [Pseudoxanthomonas composti]RXR06129.1 mechanosensitive ion channel [Pseudoxanthomonas composti]
MTTPNPHTQAGRLPLEHLLEPLQQALAPYPGAYPLAMIAALLLVAWLADWVTKRVLLRALLKLLSQVNGWLRGQEGGAPLRLRVIPRLAHIVPALVVQAGLAWIPDLPEKLQAVLRAGCKVFIVWMVALAISGALDMFNEAYERRADARNRPIKGLLQVSKIVMFVLAGLSVVATLSGVSVSHIVAGLGAIMAVLILVFQDTLLSLAASLQISSDGRVRVGDWIEMPSQNADGTVTDIALHTITVQNWDMTISTVPTKKLISESFKNWRGMYEAGGRRIKRSLQLDQHSVRFLDGAEVERLRQFPLLDAWVDQKQQEFAEWKARFTERGLTPTLERRLTNLTAFRAYVDQYLRHHPKLKPEMLMFVRELQPGANGVPVEIWCFASETGIVGYEAIQGDVIDHLLAVLPLFDLHVFQVSSDAMLMRDGQATSGEQRRILAAITGGG